MKTRSSKREQRKTGCTRFSLAWFQSNFQEREGESSEF